MKKCEELTKTDRSIRRVKKNDTCNLFISNFISLTSRNKKTKHCNNLQLERYITLGTRCWIDPNLSQFNDYKEKSQTARIN